MVGCNRQPAEPVPTQLPPTPTNAAQPTPEAIAPQNDRFLTIATDAPNQPFADFDPFGNVIGFDAGLASALLSPLNYDYEFVVTPYAGLLESVAGGEFDLAVSAIANPTEVAGIIYTEPYLEIGQLLVVLANEREIQSYNDIRPGMFIGVVANSAGENAATEVAGIAETDLNFFASSDQALQALIDGQVRGVIIDSANANYFTNLYYQQLKIAGGNGPEAWISSQQYVIALSADNQALWQRLNEAISQLETDGGLEQLTRTWLVSQNPIEAGESLVGTPPDILVIGLLGQLDSLNPAGVPNAAAWEIALNTMSGLYMFDADNNLIPVLAEGPPQLSADKLEYSFTIRPGLLFPDGSLFTAEDVKWSINRAAAAGSWHINTFLKDSDSDGYADEDAVQVVNLTTVKIILKQPVSYFLNILATPPYFVASQQCALNNSDLTHPCSGIGPYQIVEWTTNELLGLEANPQWFGPLQPSVGNVQLRFYQDTDRMVNALQLGAIDIVWSGLSAEQLTQFQAIPDLQSWQGQPTFKSYLVFEQSKAPWDNKLARQAAAYAIDRQALAAIFNGQREALYGPVPAGVPGRIDSEPERDLEMAIDLLQQVGYSPENPLEISLAYLNDNRYTPLEGLYATAIKQQLEETGIFQVTLQGEAWDSYRVEMSGCNYPTFLLGWPPVGWPTRFPAVMGWIDFFINNTDTLCSNYQSPDMVALTQQLRGLDALDTAGQLALYEQIQNLWANELPALDLTQAGPVALSRPGIANLRFDLMGLLHYSFLTKTIP